MLIKKILLTFSFIALITIAFGGTVFTAQAEQHTVSEELIKLHELYKEGIITKEEFSKAKTLLLDVETKTAKIIKKKKKKKSRNSQLKGTTAVERRDLEDLEQKKLTAIEKAGKDAKREERERKQMEEGLVLQTCEDDPDVKCPSTVSRTLKKINIFKKD